MNKGERGDRVKKERDQLERDHRWEDDGEHVNEGERGDRVRKEREWLERDHRWENKRTGRKRGVGE